MTLGPDTPAAEADPGLLDRVVANLVENALRHTPADTTVEINTDQEVDQSGNSRVLLKVVDHGPGVPQSSRDALFTPFQRLGDVPNGDGLGLGLAVARGLTEAMSGRLRAADTPDGGLTMVIDLPVAARAQPRIVAEDQVPPVDRPVPA